MQAYVYAMTNAFMHQVLFAMTDYLFIPAVLPTYTQHSPSHMKQSLAHRIVVMTTELVHWGDILGMPDYIVT